MLSLYASARTALFNHDISGLRYLKFTLAIDNLLDRKYESIISIGKISGDTPQTFYGIAGAPLAVYGSVTAAF